jgi:hypothetical protein
VLIKFLIEAHGLDSLSIGQYSIGTPEKAGRSGSPTAGRRATRRTLLAHHFF